MLAASTDDGLLGAVGSQLIHTTMAVEGLDFDPKVLGKTYTDRSLQLNPQSPAARSTMVFQRASARAVRLSKLLQNVPKESQAETILALPESERFQYLADLASAAYVDARSTVSHQSPEAAELSWDRARRYANDMLALAPRFKNDPMYGRVLYVGNLTLSALAMREGNKSSSARHMLEASKAPQSDELAYSPDFTGLESYRTC
jgi:hypothetical protein